MGKWRPLIGGEPGFDPVDKKISWPFSVASVASSQTLILLSFWKQVKRGGPFDKIPAFSLVQSLVTWANGVLSLEESKGLIQLSRNYPGHEKG